MGDEQNKEAVVKKVLTTGPEMPEVLFGRFQRAPSTRGRVAGVTLAEFRPSV